MNLKINTLIVFIVTCGLLVSCLKWGSSENRYLKQKAELLVEQMADSALILLDAMNINGFGKAEKAEYNLLRIQAKKNAGMDLATETEIFDVRDYFFHQKDPQKAALACYLSALVSAGQNSTKAIEYFQEALYFAKKTEDRELQGKTLYNMGLLNYNNEWYDDAIIRYQQALKIIQMMDNQYHLEVNTLNSIASSLMMLNKTDSAQYYYLRALDLAQYHNDNALKVMIYNNMSMAYRGQTDKASYYGRQALRSATNDNEKIYIYSNLAYVLYETGSADSARYYIHLAEKLLNHTDNIFTSAYLAYLSYQIEKNTGNYQEALEYFELRSKLYTEILENNDRKLLLEMQRKYDLTSKENELYKQKNKTLKIIGVALAILLALAVFSINTLRRYMKQKDLLAKNQLKLEKAEREKIEKTKELEQALQQALTLQDMYNQSKNTIKTKFLERIGILKEIALLSHNLNVKELNSQKDEHIIIGKTRKILKNLDLQSFIDIANELFPGFTDRLKQSYYDLDDREVSICCLILFDFNNHELDLFLNRRKKNSLCTIQTWKTTIRRKLKISPYGDIKPHLLENFCQIK